MQLVSFSVDVIKLWSKRVKSRCLIAKIHNDTTSNCFFVYAYVSEGRHAQRNFL